MDQAFKIIVEAAPYAVMVLRANAVFEIFYANQLYLDLTGTRREDLVGQPLFEVFRELSGDPGLNDPDDFRAALERFAPGDREQDWDLREIVAPDGRGGRRKRILRAANRPAFDERGELAFILRIVEDVTDLAGWAPAQSHNAVVGAPLRQLVVVAGADDVSRESLDAMLREAGFDTFLAADAQAALTACLDAAPALLLCDAATPGIGGLELTRRLRGDDRAATLPIILLSAHGGEAARIAGFEAGADDFLEQPCSPRELLARVEAAIKLSSARTEFAGRQRRIAVLARLASVVETAMDAVISIDAGQKIILFNAAAEQMFGCAAAQALGQPLDLFIPQRFRAAHARQVESFGRTGVSGRTMGRLGDLTALRVDGREFPIEASISQARVDGELLFTVILRDISERKAAAETQRLLIGELDHRVKNSLAMVQAIANQTAKAYADPKEFLENFRGRVRAMSSAHTLLTRAGWKGASLADLIREQLTPGPSDADPRILCEGPEVFIAPQFALHFGMVLHELGANARKYGALSRPEGRLDLRWITERIESVEMLTLQWVESGGPPLAPPVEKHFGTRLIESSLAHSLHARVELNFAPTGLVCTICLPLGQSVA